MGLWLEPNSVASSTCVVDDDLARGLAAAVAAALAAALMCGVAVGRRARRRHGARALHDCDSLQAWMLDSNWRFRLGIPTGDSDKRFRLEIQAWMLGLRLRCPTGARRMEGMAE